MMKLNTMQLASIYHYNVMVSKFKLSLLIVLVCLTNHVNAQRSKPLNGGVVEADSFYCNGKALANVDDKKRGEIVAVYKSIKDQHTLIEVRYISEGEGTFLDYYNFYFPDLNSNCDLQDLLSTNGSDVICKFKLINAFGLDTFRVETFVALKGNMKKKEEAKKANEENFKIVERDKTKPVVLVGNDIYQNDKILGTFEELTIESPNGTLNQIQVYNTMKQMVCLATEIKNGTHVWRIHTNQDNQYFELKTTAKSDLDDLIKYLIDHQYL